MPAYTSYQRALGLNREIAAIGFFPSRGDQNGGTVATVGMIHTYGFSYAPPGGAFANGALLPVQNWQFLFSQLGTIYGGDGSRSFGLPNLVGRVSVGWGYSGGTTPIGAELGRASFPLDGANLPESSGGVSASVSVAQPQLPTTFVINAQGVYPGGALTYDTIGVVSEFAGNFPPNDSILCDGRLLSILDFPELFTVIGTAYGGDGLTTFAVPDLRGRTIVGVDADHPLGSVTGTDTTTITQANLPTNMGGQGIPVSLEGPEIALRQIVITTGLYPVQNGSNYDISTPFLGEILTFAGSVAVGGGSDAMGQLLSIAEHQELFTLFGTTYGGDGQTTFGIPDLSDRVTVGIGGGQGAGIPSVSLGQQLGSDGVTLSSADFGPLSIIGTAGADSRWGGDSNDTINGADGDDTLTGGLGDDRIDGGTGFDIASYAYAAAGVTVTLGASGTAQNTGAAGVDTLLNIEKLVGSAFNDTLTTASVAAPAPLVITAGEHGSTGSAVMIDGSFVIGSSGTPHVTASVTGTSETYFRFTVTEAGTATFAVTDAAFDAQIALYNANGAFIGGSGFSSNHYYFARDLAVGTYYISFGSSASASTGSYTFDITVPGHSVPLTAASLDGGAGADVLTGGAGNDMLDGGTGADLLRGGAGDDSYVVDDAGDRVAERANEGYDSVSTSVSYRLANNAEDLTLMGTSAIDGTGNGSNNTILGNDAINTLIGNAGADILMGFDGADILNGGTGADRLVGGQGDDTYRVDNVGDEVVELDLGGDDSVTSSIDYTLGDFVERLTLIDGARSGVGNGLANSIIGGQSNDTLSGLAGDDRLIGNEGNDTLDGGSGKDTLEGGVGRDTLTGGTEADRFQFRNGDTSAVRAQADRITDFSHAQGDRIALNLIDAISGTGPNDAFTFIGTSAFHNVAGELRYEVISGNTYVSGDTDGNGVADLFVRVDGVVALVGADFVL